MSMTVEASMLILGIFKSLGFFGNTDYFKYFSGLVRYLPQSINHIHRISFKYDQMKKDNTGHISKVTMYIAIPHTMQA